MAEPMSDARLAEIRQIAADSRAVVARHLTAALHELLAEIDRLNTVLDANRVVRNAAESSSRTYKAVVDRLKAERTRLRAELDRCVGLNRDLVNEPAAATERAETAERELAEMRERIGETSVEYAALYTSWANSSHGETKAIGPFKTTDELLAAQDSELWPIGRDSWSLGSRLAGQWRPAEWKAAEQQPEDGDRG